MDTVAVTVIGFIGILLGAIIGAGAAYGVSLQNHKWEEQRRIRERSELRHNVRALLRLEIERNKEQAREYFRYLEEMPGEKGVELPVAKRVERLIAKPMDPWRHAMWEGQSQYLALTLDSKELGNSADFHVMLDRLSDQRVVFLEWRDKYRAAQERYAEMPASLQTEYERETGQLYAKFKEDLINIFQGPASNSIGPDD